MGGVFPFPSGFHEAGIVKQYQEYDSQKGK